MNQTLVTLVNCLLKQFNLEWTPIGLRYTVKLQYGRMDCFVTEDFNKVLSFIDVIPPTTFELEDLYYFIVNSKYYNKHLFVQQTQDHFDHVIYEFRLLIRKLKPQEPKIHDKGVLMTLRNIDTHFNTNITASKLALDKVNNAVKLRDKFNGKLVMRWATLTQGPLLAKTIESFKTHIELKHKIGFNSFLSRSTPTEIRKEFELFNTHFDSIFS